MKKLERLLYILNKLDRRERVRVSEMAKEFDVSERSVYRYLNSLIDADFPIYYDKDRGTYAFTQNFSLRRVPLETEEALVLALARRFFEPTLGDAAARVLSQIEHKIIAASQERFPHFTKVFGVQGICDPLHILELLKDISSAIREHQIVSIEYEHVPGETLDKREIEPYFVFFTGDFWYVHAWCRAKNAQRTFALDKIRTWHPTGHYFIPRKEVPSLEELQETFGPYVDDPPQEVIVHFAPEVKQYFLRRRWVKDQECLELDDGWLEVRFVVRGLLGFKFWLYRWLPHFRVVAPDHLVQEVEKDLREALDRHCGPPLPDGPSRPS